MRRTILIALLIGVLGAWLVLVAVERSYREPDNYSLIEEGLYLGGNVREPPPGTEAVLNLCEGEDPYTCEVHAWKAIRDGAPVPSLVWLAEQVEFIAKQRQAGRIVYVHCANGASRSPMVVAAYFMHKNHWTRDEVIAFLRKRRPEVRPNPLFMDLLDEWERSLKKAAVPRRD